MPGSLLFLVIGLFVPTYEQDMLMSPCPYVFMYEPTVNEPRRWYGVISLTTDNIQYSLNLDIILDSKADILGNWIGDVTTKDNINFRIQKSNIKINPGPAMPIRFFIQYNPLKKVPRLQVIKFNGREICDANALQPAVGRISRPPPIPETEFEYSVIKAPAYLPVYDLDQRNVNTDIVAEQEPEVTPVPKPIQKPEPIEPTTHKIQEKLVTEEVPIGKTMIKQGNDEDYEMYDTFRNYGRHYFQGGRILVTPNRIESLNPYEVVNRKKKDDQCGIVLRNNPNPLVVNGKPTLEGQWPWHVAIYHTPKVDIKYICGGTLISHQHVITAAHCVTFWGSKQVLFNNTLTLYLGKHNLRTSVEGVQIRLVSKIFVYPDYKPSLFSKDLSILKMREPVEYTEYVRAVCLWPENQIELSNVIGRKGSVVGWGFDETGVATEELTYVEMPIVKTETCIRSHGDFFIKYTSEFNYCAGFRDGTSVCNGDSGGGMVFKMEDYWYIRGLVSLSVATGSKATCDPRHYVVFTDIAKFLPWIEKIVNTS